MNLGEAKKRALSVMAEYSTDGVLIPDGDNQDYLLRMNGFASDAQMEIVKKVGIDALSTIIQSADNTITTQKYPLPADFRRIKSVELNGCEFNGYRIQNRKFVVAAKIEGTFELFYYKNPQELTSDTPDSYEFELDAYVQYLIPYYMGGMAIQDENPELADRLLGFYNSRLRDAYKEQEDYPQTISNQYTM